MNKPKTEYGPQMGVFRKNKSLIDFRDEIESIHQDPAKLGRMNKKVNILINNHNGQKNHKPMFAFVEVDQIEIVCFDILHGYFKNSQYPAQKENGLFKYFGGSLSKGSKVFTIKHDNGRYIFTIELFAARAGANGSVIPITDQLKETQSCVISSEFHMKMLIKNVYEHILQVKAQLIRKEKGYIDGQAPLPQQEATYIDDVVETFYEQPQPQYEETEVYVETPQLETEIFEIEPQQSKPRDIVVPSGKYSGKQLSEVPSGVKKWMVETLAAKPAWKEVVAIAKEQLNIAG